MLSDTLPCLYRVLRAASYGLLLGSSSVLLGLKDRTVVHTKSLSFWENFKLLH